MRGLRGRSMTKSLISIQSVIAPDRFAVATPEAIERPARQRLSRVPLTLAEMHEAGRGIPLNEPLIQIDRAQSLIFSECRCIPFRTLRIINRHEGRLPAHREAHIEARQVFIDRATEELSLCPLCFGVRLCDAGGFPDAFHTKRVLELNCTLIDRSGNRRRG